MIARALSSVLALSAVVAGAWSPARHQTRGGEAAGTRVAPAADSFPHARHTRLFTTCTNCHAGIARGDTATLMPAPEVCASCHNGDMQRRVDWQPRPPRATNLQLDHAPHVAMFEGMEGGAETACQRCHARADSLSFMDIGRASPDRCIDCHGQGATSHLTQQACEPCHASLHDAAQVTVAMIQSFPKPPSHEATWALRHAPAAASATCAVCHARDFCASCHVNAGSVPAIQSLASDARVAALVRSSRVSYPVPASHQADGWSRSHGLAARGGVSECANCHAQESCLGCHRAEERVPPVMSLPRRTRGGAFGVDLSGIRPADHAPDQLLRHRVPATGGDASCSRCHTQSYCAACHDGSASPAFHGRNFVQRHAQSAYTQEAECSSCHQIQAFCLNCHRALGQSSSDVPVGRFHDRQPGWLFGHGGLARRSIEGCAGCHSQDFCLKCHSATTGWRVNPHGSRFDPSVQKKNATLCRVCHENGVP